MPIKMIPWLALAGASAFSLAIKRPWTASIARRTNPQQTWELPIFRETNFVMTGVWTVLFSAFTAIAAVTPSWVSPTMGAAAAAMGALSPKLGKAYAATRSRHQSRDYSKQRGTTDMPQQRRVLADGIKGKTDPEILAYADSNGGVEHLVDATFEGMATALNPAAAQDCVFGYEITIDDRVVGYRVDIKGTKLTFEKRSPDDARATLVLSGPDYLRLITGQLDGTTAFMKGMLRIRGDMMFAQSIARMFS